MASDCDTAQELDRDLSSIQRALSSALGLPKRDNVSILDVGGWGGGHAQALRRSLGSGSTVAVVEGDDIAAPIKTNTHVVRGEATLPFEEGVYDYLYSNLGLQLVLDPDALLREMLRGQCAPLPLHITRAVLKPGGGAAVAVFGRPEFNQKLGIVATVLRRMGLPDTADTRHSCHLGDPARMTQRMRDAGFTDITASTLVAHHLVVAAVTRRRRHRARCRTDPRSCRPLSGC